MLGHVLLALSDARSRARLRRTLGQGDLAVESVDNLDALWASLARRAPDLVLVGRRLLPGVPGEAIAALRRLPDPPEVVVLDARPAPEDRARLLAAGSFAVLEEGLSSAALRDVVTAILTRRRAETTGTIVARRTLPDPRLDDFITTSPAMKAFMALVQRVAPSDASLLILGETGVGKEHLARAIHAESPRASGPFVAVNCGALAETLLESELFGHEEGAFTGATRARRGCFELADGGVVFLDEIGELPQHLQVKLLHVLQRREIQRLGGEAAIGIDVRIMAATNRDIASDVAARRFRPDLFYRLSVVTLSIPPLRERKEDIAVLVDSYLEYFRGHIRRDVKRVAPDALEALRRYDWPGNVRELVNVIERAMLLVSGEELRLEDLPAAIRRTVGPDVLVPHPPSTSHDRAASLAPGVLAGGAPAGPTSARELLAKPLRELLSKPLREAREDVLVEFERAYLSALMSETGGRINETAKRAGIEPRSLFDKLKRHGLRKEDFRVPR